MDEDLADGRAAGRASDQIDDTDLDALHREFIAKHDLVMAHALVHYLHRGHPLVLETRNHNALQWLASDQLLVALRIDEAAEFWRIRDEVLRRFDAPSGERAVSDIVGRRPQAG